MVCDSFSVFSYFLSPCQFWRFPVKHFVEWPSIWVCLLIFPGDWISGFLGWCNAHWFKILPWRSCKREGVYSWRGGPSSRGPGASRSCFLLCWTAVLPSSATSQSGREATDMWAQSHLHSWTCEPSPWPTAPGLQQAVDSWSLLSRCIQGANFSYKNDLWLPPWGSMEFHIHLVVISSAKCFLCEYFWGATQVLGWKEREERKKWDSILSSLKLLQAYYPKRLSVVLSFAVSSDWYYIKE